MFFFLFYDIIFENFFGGIMNKRNLYYRRGMFIIDKLLKNFSNDSSFYKNRASLMSLELQRMNNNKDLMVKDINSFYITAMVSLLGINKENIENMNKHDDYDLLNINESETKSLESFKKLNPSFELDRNIKTKFDKWLSVERCDYPTISYMFNIRNGILHSEFEPLDEYGDMLSINNSNYTHFKGKIILYGIMRFCMFYFGNNTWMGLTEKFNVYENDVEKQITDEKELEETIKTVVINEISYKNKTTRKDLTIPELKAYKLFLKGKDKGMTLDELLNAIFGKKYEYTKTVKALNNDQILIVKKMIDKYYGDSFYNLDKESQAIQISSITRYLFDSRSVISEWICDYVEFYKTIMNSILFNEKESLEDINKIIKMSTKEENRRSVFACRTSLLIMKLYHVLYRLQNKKYEEVDFNSINFDFSSNDYNYERIDIDSSKTYDFNIDKANLAMKNPTLSNKELENKVVCEIIRNSLSHGNIEINFKVENDELKEYIIFEDIYHHKTRKLEMTLDKLETYLNSNAFETANCILKTTSKTI